VHPHARKAELARELSRITFERWSADFLAGNPKSEIRNPKAEARKKSEARNPKMIDFAEAECTDLSVREWP
jgi:hypothetical protein